MACAQALDAKYLLFQCAASFKPTNENVSALRAFFQKKRPIEKLQYFWEPRGDDWPPELIKTLCLELGLYHTVDPFVHDSVTPEKLYYRLHGKNGWRYKYSESELAKIQTKISSKKGALVLFNNGPMVENAQQLLELIG